MDDKAKKQYKKMTETPIPELVVRLAIPAVISMLITNIYNLADTAFVGQLGNSASGAVGVVFSFMAIIQAVGFMFGQGSGSIISRLLGHQEDNKATKFATLAFFGSVAVSVVISIVSFILLDPLVYFLGSTKTIAPYAKTYITFILFAAPFMVAGFVMNNILRYEGKAMLGMLGMLTGAVLNIVLDPVLMFGLHMGISGAGLSTALSQVVSFSILLSMFVRGKTQCKISPKYFAFTFADIGNICATGLPSLLRQGLGAVTTMILNNESGVYGDEAVAAMSIVSRIAMFVVSVSLGIGQGFQPVCGFNYGAGKYDRVRKAHKFTVILSECLLGVISMIVFFLAGNLIGLFRDDEAVIEIGKRALKLQCISLLFLPPCMGTEMMLQSTGKRFGAALLSSLRSGLIFLPALIILADVRGLSGIQEAQPLSYVAAFIPAVFFTIWFFKKLPREDTIEIDAGVKSR